MRDGVPIGLGYFAVSFSLGIAAKNAGLTPFQGFLASLLCNASAGEYAGFTLIAAGATYLELAVVTLIANARYLLMSCAMSQRLDPAMPGFHRPLMAFHITDELFGIAIARPGCLNPFYSYGAVLVAAPGRWGLPWAPLPAGCFLCVSSALSAWRFMECFWRSSFLPPDRAK